MTRFTKFAAIGAVCGSVVLAAVTASAADDPANVIKYRQRAMGALAAHIGSIAMVVKGEVSYHDQVAAHARALQETSTLLPDLFPEGTDVGDTRAKPEIWQRPDKFERAAKALRDAAAELVSAAEGGDMAAIGAALQNTGKACGGCHKPFRQKKE